MITNHYSINKLLSMLTFYQHLFFKKKKEFSFRIGTLNTVTLLRKVNIINRKEK